MKLTCLESSWIFVDIFGSLEFSTISRARFWMYSEYWQRLLWRETCRVGLLPLLLIPPYVRSWWSSWIQREYRFDWKSQTTPNLNAEGEDDGALSLQVIAGHWKAFGLFCSPLELKHSFSWAEHRLVITEAKRVAQIRNSQVSKIWKSRLQRN